MTNHKQACTNTCEKTYNETFDAYFCKTCDRWLEKNCGDKACEFCASRPDKPSLMKPLKE